MINLTLFQRKFRHKFWKFKDLSQLSSFPVAQYNPAGLEQPVNNYLVSLLTEKLSFHPQISDFQSYKSG